MALAMIEGRDPNRGGRAGAQFASVSTGYFQTLRIPLVRGRVFTEHDAEKAMTVAVVSDSLVRKFFANENPVGRRIRIPGRLKPGPWMTIVGVVRDVKTEALDALAVRILYRRCSGLQDSAVRGGGSPAALGSAIERRSRGRPGAAGYGVRRWTRRCINRQPAARRNAPALLFAAALLCLGHRRLRRHRLRRAAARDRIRMALAGPATCSGSC
jgi:hypothetical protein